jgi:hypothetical protein
MLDRSIFRRNGKLGGEISLIMTTRNVLVKICMRLCVKETPQGSQLTKQEYAAALPDLPSLD